MVTVLAVVLVVAIARSKQDDDIAVTGRGGAGTPSGSSGLGPSSQEPLPSEATSSSQDARTETSEPDALPANPACSAVSLGLEERARLTLFVTITSDRSDLDHVVTSGVGGVFVPTSAVDLLVDGTVRSAVGVLERPPLVAVDEEGGRVQRLRDHLGPLPAARDMAGLGPDAIRELAEAHGEKLRSLGVTMDLAPVVDVVGEGAPANGVIGDRSFSSDPTEVTEAAGAFAAGLVDAGLLPTYKHFPGHGRASGDSHELIVTTPPLDELGPDLAPYEALLTDPPAPVAVMVGHLLVPGLTGDLPASVSPAAITGLLRREIGFDGLVLTDDLGAMRGILDRFSTVEAAALALEAGADMVLVPADQASSVVDAVVRAVRAGTLDEAQLTRSADRILRAQQPERCQTP